MGLGSIITKQSLNEKKNIEAKITTRAKLILGMCPSAPLLLMSFKKIASMKNNCVKITNKLKGVKKDRRKKEK